MTQNKEATLLDSIQSEVSKEASPMLEFLVKHARKIFLFLAALIALIVVVGVFSYSAGSKQREAEETLGKILIQPETSAKLAALEEFSAGAPKKMQTAVFMAIAHSAALQNNMEKAAEAWGKVAASADTPTRFVAGIAQATALAAQDKVAEAIVQLESMLASAPSEAKSMLNAQIVDLAERSGNWDKAIAASDAVLTQMGGAQGREVWEQRKAYFISKK